MYDLKTQTSSELNFGHIIDTNFSVKKVTSLLLEKFNNLTAWGVQSGTYPKEFQVLLLNLNKDGEVLTWK